jgi:prepilin-type N-terminal cleavage/methylation domain-containing protein
MDTNGHECGATRHRSTAPGGFTLIELLTVISIIALLATIGAALSGVAIRKARESRVRAEQGKLVTGIEAYRADFNQYPPDNARNGVNVDPAVHGLYYELVGSVSSEQGRYYMTADSSDRLTSAAIAASFGGAGGFVNSAIAPDKPKIYLADLNQRQRRRVKLRNGAEVELLTVSGLDWPTKNTVQTSRAPLAGRLADDRQLAINPWQYVSTRPTNNPSSFDLWALLPSGRVVNNTNEYRILGNWKE